MRYLLFLACLPLSAALSVSVTSVNQTQAILREQGFSGACTIAVSTSPSFSPVVPDLNGTEYSGAATDTGRSDTYTSTDGLTRTVTVGHQTDDRALAAFTVYYYQVSGCGTAVTGNFVTANLSTGTTHTEQSPFNAAKWGSLGLPAFDWTTKKTYTDPLTGVTLTPMATSVQTWRTGGISSSSRAFTDWSAGSASGWTNPGHVLNGASATDVVDSGTTPIDLFLDMENDKGVPTGDGSDPVPYDLHRTLEDIGLVIWGSGTNSGTADRTINACLVLNPSVGCVGNTIPIVLPQTTFGAVAAPGSTDPDGAWPAAFPSSPFYGWTGSKTPIIRMENRETFGSPSVNSHGATVSGNSLSIGEDDGEGYLHHFSNALASGSKIYIAGSGCTNNLCTLSATPSTPFAATVSETPGNGTFVFRAYGWNVRLWKANANGSVTFGAKVKLAGSNTPIGVASGGDKCNANLYTAPGDGAKGYLCSITSTITGSGWLAFIGLDGATRILSLRTGFSFDDTQNNMFYAGTRNGSGGWTVNRTVYTGDAYTYPLDYAYQCTSNGGCQAWPRDALDFTSVDLMPHIFSGSTANGDLDQQIEAAQGVTLPPYDKTLYGDWNSGQVGYYGSSGHFAFFCNLYSGQGQPTSGGPGWCASVDLSQYPARVVRLIHTLDGTGAPNARFGSLHSAQQVDSNPNTLFMSLDGLQGSTFTTSGTVSLSTPLLLTAGSLNSASSIQSVTIEGAGVGGLPLRSAVSSVNTGTNVITLVTPASTAVTNATVMVAQPGVLGTISLSTPTTLTVDTTSNVSSLATLVIHGAGASGGNLASTIANISGNTITLNTAASTAVTNAAVTPLVTNGGPFQAIVQQVLEANGVTWNNNTALPWPPDSSYYRSCPGGASVGSLAYTECVTLHLPQGGVCNVGATPAAAAANPCLWNSAYSQYPVMQAGDFGVDLVSNTGNTDNEHFHVISVSNDGSYLKVVAARNGTYDYCSINPWHGITNPLVAPLVANQVTHANGWTLTMTPGTFNSCGGDTLFQEQTAGNLQELGRSFSAHFQTGRGPNGINFVTGNSVIYNTPFASLGALPSTFNTFSVGWSGVAGMGSQMQSYTDDSQLSAGASGYPWAVDMNPYVSGCGGERLGCGDSGRGALTPLGSNLYQIGATGTVSASNANYKTHPMIGWAGRFQLQDVSQHGAGSITALANTPYSMCYAIAAGECYSTSSANQMFINVPVAYDPGYCSGSLSWVNDPCIVFGDDTPGGSIRQFKLYSNDLTGAGSRAISMGWSSLGRHYSYTHSTVYPNGQWAMLMGTNLIDGFSMTGFMISLPPWTERGDPNNVVKNVPVTFPAGAAYAEVQFGYSRYGGPSQFFCTSRAEACNTSGSPLNFDSETRSLTSCTSGCTISIPTIAPNVLYYRTRRSSDGVAWTSSDVQAIALQ